MTPSSPKTGEELEISATGPSDQQIVRAGDIGESVTKLRPTGRARFGEILVDVVAQGEFIDIHTPVKVLHVYGNRVVVKPQNSDERTI